MNSPDYTVKHTVTVTARQILRMLRENGVPIPEGKEHDPALWAEVPDWHGEEGSVRDEQIHCLEVTWHVYSKSILEAKKAAAEERKKKLLSELSINGEVHQMRRTRKALHPPVKCRGDNRDRRWRLDADSDTCEYLYRTPAYLSIALKLNVGTPAWVTPASGNVYRGVWLTEEEHVTVKGRVAEENRKRAARKKEVTSAA